jgi:hypothetical protein
MCYVTEYRNAGAEIFFSEKVSGAEIYRAKNEFFAYPFSGNCRYVICDFTNAGAFDVSPEDVDLIVAQDKRAMESHPVLMEAVVAPRPVVFGLARMWQSKVDVVRPHTAVVKTRAEAIAWLQSSGLAGVLDDDEVSVSA